MSVMFMLHLFILCLNSCTIVNKQKNEQLYLANYINAMWYHWIKFPCMQWPMILELFGCISTWLQQLHNCCTPVTLVVKPSMLFFHLSRHEFYWCKTASPGEKCVGEQLQLSSGGYCSKRHTTWVVLTEIDHKIPEGRSRFTPTEIW